MTGEMGRDFRVMDNPFCEKGLRLQSLASIVSEEKTRGSGKPNGYPLMDLHLHSNYSDGFWTPSGLLLEAWRAGMTVIGLTDHDSFHGIEEGFEAREVIERVTGKRLGFIPGIEFSTNYRRGRNPIGEIHILGYFLCGSYQSFRPYLERLDIYAQAYLDAFQKCRVLRIYEMVKKFNEEMPFLVGGKLLELSKAGEPISMRTAKRGLRGSVAPGRLLACTGIFEIARLQELGRLGEISDEAFTKSYTEKMADFMEPFDSPHQFMLKYFDSQKPSAKVDYIGKTIETRSAVQLIASLGGIPVLAHPILYPDLLEELLRELTPLGLQGVEVVSGNAPRGDLDRLLKMDQFLERRYPGLFVTAGSDDHGRSADGEFDYTPENRIGWRENLGPISGLLRKHEQRMKIRFLEDDATWA